MIFIVIASLWPMTGLSQSSSPTDHFRTKGNGNWNQTTIWESSPDGLDPWISATICPSNTTNAITIRDGNTVSVTSTVYADQLTIMPTGKLILPSTGILTINNGDGVDLTVFGILELHKFLSYSLNPEIIIKDGGFYNKYLQEDTQLNVCTWETGSTIRLISGPSLTSIQNLNQNFHHVIWDGTAQTLSQILGLPNGWSISGDLTIANTNLKSVILTNSSNTVNYYIDGSLKINQYSRVSLSDETGRVNISVNGDINLAASAKLYLAKQATSLNTVYLKGNIGLTSTSDINDASSYIGGTINFCNIGINQEVNNSGDINCVNYVLSPAACVSFNLNQLNLSNNNYKLDIKNNASLKNSTSVPATIERTLSNADWTVPLDGWHLISSPVIDQSVATGGFTYPSADPNYSKYDFYKWHEGWDKWLNQKVDSNNIDNFIPGTGYFVAYDEGGTKTFTGNLNVSNITKTNFTITGTSPYAGFHLLGNPFQCSLDWSNAAWGRAGVSEVAHVWNEEAMNYLFVNSANPYIPPNQGFFVQAINSVNSITIPTAARCHHSGAFNKMSGDFTSGNSRGSEAAFNKVSDSRVKSSDAGEIDANLLWIKVQGRNSTPWDEAMIRFDESASSGFDLLDGHELAGSEVAPQLYTALSDGEFLSVNALPLNGYPSMLPLFFRHGTDEDYRLTVLENTIQKEIWLEDKQTNNFMLLHKGSFFDFPDTISWESSARFVLHMGPLGLQEDQENDFQIYSYENRIYIRDLAGGANSFDYRLLNLAGRTLRKGKATGKTLNVIQISECPPGIYLVTVTGRNHTQVQKIFLR